MITISSLTDAAFANARATKGRSAHQGVVCAALTPHAPILVPPVGGARGQAAAATIRALRSACSCVMAHHPEAIVVISPHAPRKPGSFGIWEDNPVAGSFAGFGVPETMVSLPLDAHLARGISAQARQHGLETWVIHRRPLDHGALVPLWFLAEAGWHGQTVVLGLDGSDERDLVILGEAIAAAATDLRRRIALIASGDMSHRLQPDAPCGFHPQAHRFDECFIELVRQGDYHQLQIIPPELRETAAEDVLDSTLIAAAAVHWQSTAHQVLNYEGPFGVGYGVAILFSERMHPPASAPKKQLSAADIQTEGATLPLIARRSVAAALAGSPEGPPQPAPANNYLNRRCGVFVTIRRHGSLQGCMGTVVPACADVISETWHNARLAAFQDTRFSPVTAGMLNDLRFEVSVLHPPEEVASSAELDPEEYGAIVSTDDGRRGLLLPHIKNIHTPEEQLRFARRKAGIGRGEPVTLRRFRVDRFEDLNERII